MQATPVVMWARRFRRFVGPGRWRSLATLAGAGIMMGLLVLASPRAGYGEDILIEESEAAAEESNSATETAEEADEAVTRALIELIKAGKGEAKKEKPATPPSHARQRAISVKGIDDRGTLETFCLAPDGNLVAVITMAEAYGKIAAAEKPGDAATGPAGELRVYSPDGDLATSWTVDFKPQRAACAPDGTVYVAGSGFLERFTAEGQSLGKTELPHVATLLADKDALRKKAEVALKQDQEAYRQAMKGLEQTLKGLEKQQAQLTRQIEEQAAAEEAERQRIEEEKAAAEKAASENAAGAEENPSEESNRPKAKKNHPADGSAAAAPVDDGSTQEPADEPPPRKVKKAPAKKNAAATRRPRNLKQLLAQAEAQITQYRGAIESYNEALKQMETGGLEAKMGSLVNSMGSVHAISVDSKRLVYVTRMATGHGFAVWGANPDGTEARVLLEGLSGCCGQMDVKVSGDELFVAENSRHRVRRVSLDGETIKEFGGREREGGDASFGGCCNPMNLCLCGDGSLLTAESEGRVKRFTTDGQFLGLVASPKLAGGCKHVAVAVSADQKQVYFYDRNASQILVLEAEETEDE